MSRSTRRSFLRTTLAGTAGAIAFPYVISPRLWGAEPAPSMRINMVQIGCGRIARDMDLRGFISQPGTRIVGVCDVDRTRLEDGRRMVVEHYRKKGEVEVDVATTVDYRELLGRPDVDAVIISTPDHWHALPVIEAALAGKDVYVQKPLALTIAESEAARRIVRAKGRILQMGSQQRSSSQFHKACELVRNGRIGKVHTIKIGLPNDPAGKVIQPQPVPANLDYDRWLGSVTDDMPYIEERVHPQSADLRKRYDRPGWLRVEAFSAGMITGWGSHHIDIAHWALGGDTPGPIAIEATGTFPTSGIWNVHTAYHIEALYPNDVRVIVDDKFKNGVLFEGSEGWIFVTRGAEKVTASDPDHPNAGKTGPLQSSKPEILTTPLDDQAVRLHKSTNHFGDFLEGIRTRKDPVAHVDAGSYTFNAISAMWVGMKLKRKLKYDPAKAEFPGDDEANRLRSRPQRPAYSVDAVVKKAGF